MDSTVFGEPVVEIPGAILLSGFLQFFLLGIIVMQAMSYWADYKDDSRKKRIFIAMVVFLSLCVTCPGYVYRLTSSCALFIVCRPSWRATRLGGLQYFGSAGYLVQYNCAFEWLTCIMVDDKPHTVVGFLS